MQQSLGTYLKQARESRKLSLEEVSFLTKIKKHYLEALEEDTPDVLPSRVQGKGFLRLYADFLDLDEKRVITAWETPNFLMPTPDAPATIPDHPPIQPVPQEDLAPQTPESSELSSSSASPQPLEQYIHFGRPQDTTPAQPTVAESQTVFVEIGKTLQEHRQSLHLSLEEIEQYTNIRAHYLKALETGHLEGLPSPVQGRGMLSNYAKFLNLDHEALLLQFANGLQLRRTEQLSPQQRETKSNQNKSPSSQASNLLRKYLSLDFILTIVLIMGVFGIILFAAAQIASPNISSQTTAPPSISDVLLENTDQPVEASATPTVFTTGLAGLPLVEETETTGEETPIPEGSLPLQLYVIAKQRAFLRITADESIVFDGRTVPGNAYEFSAETQLELLTGNAAAVEVYFNQENMGSLGEDSQVASLLFTLDQGIITPTPRFTLMPTNTTQPSATITPTPLPTQTIAAPTPTVTPFIP